MGLLAQLLLCFLYLNQLEKYPVLFVTQATIWNDSYIIILASSEIRGAQHERYTMIKIPL